MQVGDLAWYVAAFSDVSNACVGHIIEDERGHVYVASLVDNRWWSRLTKSDWGEFTTVGGVVLKPVSEEHAFAARLCAIAGETFYLDKNQIFTGA